MFSESWAYVLFMGLLTFTFVAILTLFVLTMVGILLER